MIYLRFLFVTFFLCISYFNVKSQVGEASLSIKIAEDSIASFMKQIYTDNPTSVKEAANNKLIALFKATLISDEAFNYSFDSLKHIGKITSEDKRIRIFSWNVPQLSGYQKYYGFILVKSGKEGIRLIELTDNRKAISNPIKDILRANNWMGSLYYSVVDVSYKGDKYYLLLGLDFNNLFSSKKIIDVLTFGKDLEPIFGSSVFHVGDAVLNRVVFEFSARANMMLRYIPETKTIVFDHLSPSRPDFAGNYQFYGPDFTYDGFKFEKGKWVYVMNLDLKNTKRERGKPRENPEKFPDPGFLYKSKSGIPMQLTK